MSTRCNILFKQACKPDIWMYHHSDGYPDGVGRDLKTLVKNLNRGWRWGYFGEDIEDLVHYIQRFGMPSQWGVDGDYEITDCQHGDIEYLYTIIKRGNSNYILIGEGLYEDYYEEYEGNDEMEVPPSLRRYSVKMRGSLPYEELSKRNLDFGYGGSLDKVEWGKTEYVDIDGIPCKITRCYSAKCEKPKKAEKNRKFFTKWNRD